MSEKLETFGVKVNPETKEKIQNMIKESGVSGREFIERLLLNYQTSQLNQNNNPAIKELEKLEKHLNRIKEIYIEQAKSVEDIQREFDDELAQKNQVYTETIEAQQDKIQQLKEQLADSKKSTDIMASENNQLVGRLSELEESNRALSKTNELYEGKIKDLTGRIKGLEQQQEEYLVLKTENTDLDIKVQRLETEIREVNRQKESEISKLQINQEKAILEMQRNQAQELKEAQNEFNKRINELHQSYSKRIEVMTEQIEKVRNELSKATEEKYSLQSDKKAMEAELKLIRQQVNQGKQENKKG